MSQHPYLHGRRDTLHQTKHYHPSDAQKVSGYKRETIKAYMFIQSCQANAMLNVSADEEWDYWRGEKEMCLFYGLPGLDSNP